MLRRFGELVTRL